MNIASKLQQIAELSPNLVAIQESTRFASKSISFSQLALSVEKLALKLTRLGIRRGDNILIMHPMSIELYEFIIALFRIGAVGVFIDPSFGSRHIRRALAMCRPVASFSSTKALLWQLTKKDLHRIPIRMTPQSLRALEFFPVEQPLINVAEKEQSVHNELESPALITFTSGSNGAPKGIVRTHQFLQEQLCSITETLQLRHGQRDLTTLPIFALANLATGVTTVIPHRGIIDAKKMNARIVARQIRDHQIDRMSLSPMFLDKLCESGSAADLTSLHQIYVGGGPVFPDILRRTKLLVPGAKITAVYGSTECEPIAAICVDDITTEDWQRMERGAGLLAGHVTKGVELRLAQCTVSNLNSSEREMGEIIVAGPHTVKGYLKGLGNMQTKLLLDGQIWHRTGDAGYLDQSGRLWLVGRCSAAMRDDSGVIYPFQVESAIRAKHNGMRSACFSFRTKRVLVLERTASKMFLRKKASVSPDAIIQELDWAQIDRVVQVRSLPLDARHRSKVDYPALREMLAQIS